VRKERGKIDGLPYKNVRPKSETLGMAKVMFLGSKNLTQPFPLFACDRTDWRERR